MQIQNGLLGKFGREDGVGRGQALSGIQDSVPYKSSRDVVAALLAEMQDVQGFVTFENCDTGFMHSKCIRQGGVEAPVLWSRVAKYVLWKAEVKWKATGWGLTFGGENDNECVLRCMMWADNYWSFFDNKERLVCMVSDTIEELLELEPKPESLWLPNTH